MEVAELKMLRFSLGVTRMDKIRNEYIRGTAQVGKFGEKTREARLRWYGHLRRKDDGYIGRRMLRMELPGKRKRGRPKRRFMDVVKEDMAEVEVTEEDTVDRRNWRKKIRCGDPWWEKPKEEEDSYLTNDQFQFNWVNFSILANRPIITYKVMKQAPNQLGTILSLNILFVTRQVTCATYHI